MSSHERQRRVGLLIQQEVTALLAKGLKDPRIGFVTVTGVEMSPDLRYARVFYATHGSDAERKATHAGLERAAGWLRRRIAPLIRIKAIPSLVFVYDEGVERGDRMNRLLEQVKRDDDARAADAGTGGDIEDAE